MLVPLLILVAAGSAAATGEPAQTTASANQALQLSVGAILQADGPKAREILAGIQDQDLSATAQAFRQCALARLTTPVPSLLLIAPKGGQPDRFVTALLDIYRIYWTESLARPNAEPTAAAKLLQSISTLLAGTPFKSMDDAERSIALRLEASGFHSQEGQTGRLRDLMIWRSQTTRIETVRLPEGTNATQVNYLDDFVSRGWSTYFTCDRTGTGGWTKPDGLYVIVPAYKSLTDETFRVNFLAHESQHYADHRQFPHLADWELEYRAKLVELATTETTRDKTLGGFSSNQGDDPQDPHSFANKRVLAALRSRLRLPGQADLSAVPGERLRKAAIAELKADTNRRMALAKRAR